MSIQREPEVLSSVSIPHEGPIGLLKLIGPSDPVECEKLRQRIEKSIAPMLETNRFLRELAEVGLCDPTVYR